MENYHKAEKQKVNTNDNEIRVSAKGQIRNYLKYVTSYLESEDHRTIEIKATGNAIPKLLILVEIIKRSIGNLHQLNNINSMNIVDVYEPNVEGMDVIEEKRRVTAMETILSKDSLEPND